MVVSSFPASVNRTWECFLSLPPLAFVPQLKWNLDFGIFG